ncbi:MAG: dihydrolipoyl dehydrogenase family protein [Opitutales bacterium]
MESFDFIVIGGGSAGYAGARTARETHERVAIVDGADPLGGLCILRGCMPSKTLIYGAEILHHARHADRFALDIPEARPKMPAFQDRKKAIIGDFAAYRQEQLASDRFRLYRAHARFVDPHTIELTDGTRIHGERFLIATGSVVATPPVPGLAETPHWTSDDVLDLDFVPESVIVLGGGVVACELAQYLNRLGSRVIQIQRSERILKDATPEGARVVEQAFRDEGIELFTGTKITGIRRLNTEVEVVFEHGGQTVTRTTAFLFNALGRKPAVDGLDLDRAGVRLRPSGHIEANAFQQTAAPHIYAAGDVCGPVEIVHIAILQGEAAARHALGHAQQPMDFDGPAHVIFTDPQFAGVGLSLEKARARGYDPVAADFPFDDHGKAILMEARYGYVKVVADKKDGAVLGAECVGKDAGELIHAMAVAVALKTTVHAMKAVQWYHPTLSEIWDYPLDELREACGRPEA